MSHIDFFALYRDFLHITSFIGMLQASFFQEFKVHGFMDVCTKFLRKGSFREGFIRVKVGSITGLSY